jgi:uncharacterized protein YndB with AHSA1/START domain
MNATALLVPKQNPSGAPARAVRPEAVERSIQLNTTVGADKRRVFDALTLPEYREAWLRFPDGPSGGRTAATCADNFYRLDYFVDGGLEFSVAGAYRACRRSRMVFTWRKSSATNLHLSVPETLVTIRLQGAFSDTTVSVDHAGLFSSAEFRWHSDMWRLSLEKLRSLF